MEAFVYTSCYCEENVYLLCKSLVELGTDVSDLFVVFLLSADEQVPIWCQKNSRYKDGFCIWDYHVICIQKSFSLPCEEASVWDLDTSLGIPVPFSHYVNDALRPQVVEQFSVERLFRVVSAPNFLKHFASDRRHMKTENGAWLSSPPDYECIISQDGTIHNLERYLDSARASQEASPEELLQTLLTENIGCVLSEEKFYHLFEKNTVSKSSSVCPDQAEQEVFVVPGGVAGDYRL